MSLVSSWFTYGNILYNYAPTQAILPVLYLLAACLEEGELRWLRRMCGLWVCAARTAPRRRATEYIFCCRRCRNAPPEAQRNGEKERPSPWDRR